MSKKAWLDPVPFRNVEIRGSFWERRIEVNSGTTIPLILKEMEKSGRISAFDLDWSPGAGQKPHIFWDSDVWKWIEAASCALDGEGDKKAARDLERVVKKAVAAQQEDGYLNTYFTAVDPGGRWKNLRDNHELYCAGHMMEAAAAHFEATGSRLLLDAACRYADLIGRTFGGGRGRRRGYPGHQEVELALVRLFRTTGKKRYLTLARYFIDERGAEPNYFDREAKSRKEDKGEYRYGTHEYNQAHAPVREQAVAVGHAVRALYMYSGMTDIARETGDSSLLSAAKRLWKNVCLKQMYVTGGAGATSSNEGFTGDYNLPEESAYAESCAAVAMVFFNHRMLQATRDSRYADALELALYNNVAAGVSMDGTRFFYSNSLSRDSRDRRGAGGKERAWDGWTYSRRSWFGCACCPSNIARLIAGLGCYFYSTSSRGMWVHLYESSSASVEIGNTKVAAIQETEYPWDGLVKVRIEPEKSASFDLNLRIPGWCTKAGVRVNGRRHDLERNLRRGYAVIKRRWRTGDVVELSMSMPVEQVRAHPRVKDALGKVALKRGPLVYCVEEADNASIPLERVAIDKGASPRVDFVKGMLGGVSIIRADASFENESEWRAAIYGTRPVRSRAAKLLAVPYCVWDNRALGAMRVWIKKGSSVRKSP